MYQLDNMFRSIRVSDENSSYTPAIQNFNNLLQFRTFFPFSMHNSKPHHQLSTFSEIICSAFQFHGHLAQKYEWMPEKEQMKSERVENCWCGFEWCILNTQRVWSSNKFQIMKSLCNRWVFVRNPDTSNEIVRFVHEVHPVFAVSLSTFLHMLCRWNDDTMPTFNLFRVHL